MPVWIRAAAVGLRQEKSLDDKPARQAATDVWSARPARAGGTTHGAKCEDRSGSIDWGRCANSRRPPDQARPARHDGAEVCRTAAVCIPGPGFEGQSTGAARTTDFQTSPHQQPSPSPEELDPARDEASLSTPTHVSPATPAPADELDEDRNPRQPPRREQADAQPTDAEREGRRSEMTSQLYGPDSGWSGHAADRGAGGRPKPREAKE